jgi:hypothetical protein
MWSPWPLGQCESIVCSLDLRIGKNWMTPLTLVVTTSPLVRLRELKHASLRTDIVCNLILSETSGFFDFDFFVHFVCVAKVIYSASSLAAEIDIGRGFILLFWSCSGKALVQLHRLVGLLNCHCNCIPSTLATANGGMEMATCRHTLARAWKWRWVIRLFFFAPPTALFFSHTIAFPTNCSLVRFANRCDCLQCIRLSTTKLTLSIHCGVSLMCS